MPDIADRQWFVRCGGPHAGKEVTQPSHLANATAGCRFEGRGQYRHGKMHAAHDRLGRGWLAAESDCAGPLKEQAELGARAADSGYPDPVSRVIVSVEPASRKEPGHAPFTRVSKFRHLLAVSRNVPDLPSDRPACAAGSKRFVYGLALTS
jgi:hypothetical protein